MQNHRSPQRALLGVAAALLPVLSASTPPVAEPPALVLGVVLPAGDAALEGVRFGAAEATRAATLFGREFILHEAPAATAPAAAAAASRLIRDRGIAVLIGGADAAATAALMTVAERERLVFINVGAHADSLRLRCGRMTFHVAPASAMLRDAIAAAGAPAGARAVAWHPALERFGAGQVNDRFTAVSGRPLDERAWAGWFAVKVAWEAALRSDGGPRAIAEHLATTTSVFDGHKGIPLSFRERTHQLRQPLYVVRDEAVIAETPSPRDAPGLEPALLLDRIGNLDEEARCTGS